MKDSGERKAYSTGAQRDTDTGKPRYDLISAHMLTRLAHHLRKGAEKYGDRNWEKGIPKVRLIGSALRHTYQYLLGDRTEDHLSAIIFNWGAVVHFEEVGGNPADAPLAPPAPQKPRYFVRWQSTDAFLNRAIVRGMSWRYLNKEGDEAVLGPDDFSSVEQINDSWKCNPRLGPFVEVSEMPVVDPGVKS